jgi:hypothetical protein
VIGTPLLLVHNRYACLFVDEIQPAPTVNEPDCVQAVQSASESVPSEHNPRLRRWERRLPRKYIVASAPSQNSLSLNVEIETTDTELTRSTPALVDCGATGLFMDAEWARMNDISTRSLTHAIPVYNVDGTPNEAGAIREIADVVLRYNGHSERAQFAITQLGKQNLILGFTWLREHNPEVDWQTKEVRMSRCPSRCNTCRLDAKRVRREERVAAAQTLACRAGAFPVLVEEVEDEEEPPGLLEDEEEDDGDYTEIEDGDGIFVATVYPDGACIRATSTVSQRLAEAFSRNTQQTSFHDTVPESLHTFEDVFNKDSFDTLPEQRKWDHAIELEREPTPGFRKVYPMSLEEQAELDAFLEEALSTGCIRPSKSPIGAPVFFVKKKDGKLRFVQDYRALNAITRKNRYPLPLIDDLIHRLSGAKYFTKLDIRWGYNNIRIKEGDEWKAAFRTNRGLFEPLVMYFGLTNSPATFQTMINEVFQDLILQGVVCIYLDDILIFTKTLEEHRHISQLVLERLHQHRLYL